MSPRNERERLEAIWRHKLHEAEQAYRKATAQAKQVKSEYDLMPPSDGNLALARALHLQSQAMDDYAQMLQTFTRLVLYGEQPEKSATPEPAGAASPGDVDIQEWVRTRYGFVPHPAWIEHCRGLYLGAPPERRPSWLKCPPDRREAIRDAFVALGMLPK